MKDIAELYLEDISKYPLLSAEEERKLFEIYHRTEDPLEKQQARNKIIEAHLRLVVNVVKRFYGVQDLLEKISAGNKGLFAAIENFDITKGKRFSYYAVYYIRKLIQRDYYTYRSTIDCPPQARALIAKIEQIVNDHLVRTGTKPSDEYVDHEIRKTGGVSERRYKALRAMSKSAREDIRILLAPESRESINVEIINNMALTLKSRQWAVLYLHCAQEQTLDQIGALYNMTKEGVRQSKNTSIRQLRKNFGPLEEICQSI